MSKATIPGISDTADVKARIITVTPALARQWLGLNDKNRKPRNLTVRKYAADMAGGRWQFTAEPIKFDTNGKLIDGQHRLMAISTQSETFTLEVLVVTGIDTSAQSVMDTGSKRTGADALQLAGIKNSALIASSTKWMIIYERGMLFRDNTLRSSQVTTASIAEWVEDHPEDVTFMQALSPFTTKLDCFPSPATAAGALINRQTRGGHGGGLVLAFFDTLANGGADRKSPINMLDQKFRVARLQGRRFSERDQIGLIITAWNAWITGKSMKVLRIPGGSFSAKTFPQIVTTD